MRIQRKGAIHGKLGEQQKSQNNGAEITGQVPEQFIKALRQEG